MTIMLLAIALMYCLWLFFLAVMSLKRARDAKRLTTTGAALGWPILSAGYVLDFVGNMIVMTMLMVELPSEWFVTSRIKRHLQPARISRFRVIQFVREFLTPWRKRVAQWFDRELLDPIDPGHCY